MTSPRRPATTTRPPRTTTCWSRASPGPRARPGYFGYTYYEENTDKLKALSIDDGNGCVAPSAETAQAGEYTPLARPLFIYVNKASYADNAAVKEYVDFYIENLADHRGGGQVHPAERGALHRDQDGPRGHLRLTAGAHATHERQIQRRCRPILRDGPARCSRQPPRTQPARSSRSSRSSCSRRRCSPSPSRSGIIIALIGPVLDFFTQVPFGDFFATEGEFAVIPLVTGTLMVTFIALLVAVPLGLGAAMYLSEYATPRVRKALKPTVELLAGVPSVVYGFFALAFVTPTLLQDILSLEVNFTNALSAGLVLGVMVIPTIASLAEDALTAVPQAMRQGSLAMGANRMQTTLRVVLPAALSGVAAAVVLGMSRAIGETMIVALAAGGQRNLSADPREGMQTMTGYIAQTAGGESPVGSVSYNMLFAVGLLLFVITLIINIISIAIVRRYRQAY